MSQIKVIINGQEYTHWNAYTISSGYDALSAFSIYTPALVSEEIIDEGIFVPFSSDRIQIYISDQLMITGTIVSMGIDYSASKKTIHIQGGSLPIKLQQGEAAKESFPLEYNETTLEGIAKSICTPLGITVKAEFSTVALSLATFTSTTPVWTFLVDLAKQYGVVLSDNAEGNLFLRPKLFPNPQYDLSPQVNSLIESMTITFDSEKSYGKIRVQTPVSDNDEEDYTLPVAGFDPTRIKNISLPNTSNGDLKPSALSALSRMLKDSFHLTLKTKSFVDPIGKLWQVGDTFSYENAKYKLPTPSVYVIDSIIYSGSASQEEVTMKAVLGASYTYVIPKKYPWEQP